MEDYGLYSDAELALFMRGGDAIAFREIYKRYSELLYIFAYRKLKNESEARDVVHDVFAWLLEKGETLTLHGSLSSYLYKSVLNRIFDIFRKKETFQRYIDQGEHYIDVDSEGTDYLIREKDIRALIDKEIAAMPPRMREVFELRYRQHRSHQEISDQLNISTETVKTHIKHAHKHLKDKLGVVIFLLYILH
ncbi:RNA polymerase sigma factor [Sphingobacterium lactis]|nr:RNA polymerase sigma-70 factor [Sphingobacterium hotanense]MCT1525075.1 RNA polymerase sigma-70 factor [Sphingobacterium hotanense]